MKKFYFTFGYDHILLDGSSASNCYTIVEAENMSEARIKMNKVYNRQWAFCYNSPEEFGRDEYNVREVQFGQ